MDGADHELEFLLSLDGSEFRFNSGFVIKIEAQLVTVSVNRPQGIKYSLTLHDPDGRRIYGMDNAHGVRRQTEFDHRHVYGGRKIVGYQFRGSARLLADFYQEAERILNERGVR